MALRIDPARRSEFFAPEALGRIGWWPEHQSPVTIRFKGRADPSHIYLNSDSPGAAHCVALQATCTWLAAGAERELRRAALSVPYALRTRSPARLRQTSRLIAGHEVARSFDP